MNNKLATVIDKHCLEDDLEIDYLLLPTIFNSIKQKIDIDWVAVNSVNPSIMECPNHVPNICTDKGQACACIVQNALLCTPHTGHVYITTGMMGLDGNSPLELRDGVTTYKKYFGEK